MSVVEVAPPSIEELNEIWEASDEDKAWVIVVYDDPVNTMVYVTLVFMEYFGFSKEKAVKKMFEVHEKGRSVLADGTRDEMLVHKKAMTEYGLLSGVEQLD